MKILVTGSTGFIGKYLMAHLQERFPNASLIGVSPRVCDLGDSERTVSQIKSLAPDVVYHLAGLSRVRDSWGLDKYFAGNFLTTANLLKGVASLARPVQFFFTSSVQVYGAPSHPAAPASPALEDDLPRPSHYYGFSKYLAEEALRAFSAKHPESRFVVGRLYNCIGPGQQSGFAIADWCLKIRQLQDGGTLQVGSLDGIRSFLDVRDTVKTFPDLLAATQEKFSIYNIGSEAPVKLAEAIEQLLTISGKRLKVESSHLASPNSFAGISINTEKFRKTLPAATFRPLIETLRDMYETTV